MTWRPEQKQPSELRQPFKVLQPGVGHLRVDEIQELELGQPFEMLKPSVRDLRVVEKQLLELGQPLRCSRPASVTLVLDKFTEVTGLPGLFYRP